MLEIEALEREAERKEERAKEGGEKGALEHNLPSPLQPPPPQLGPSMALGESDDDDDEEEDGEDEEEEGGERERPIRLTNHTCESCDPGCSLLNTNEYLRNIIIYILLYII